MLCRASEGKTCEEADETFETSRTNNSTSKHHYHEELQSLHIEQATSRLLPIIIVLYFAPR